MNNKILLTGLVAIIMVTCAIPFVDSDDTDALVGSTDGMSLNLDSAVIYTNGTPNSVTLTIETTPTGVDASNAVWYLNNIDDGTSFVSLSSTTGLNTIVSANDLPEGKDVASVEVVASITDGESTHTASAVIVVYPSPSETATTFHYYIKIDDAAIKALESKGIDDTSIIVPSTTTLNALKAGFWISVSLSDTGLDASAFNALSALQWYMSTNQWSYSIGSYGWIDTLLGLGTYSGDDGTWYYWAQYHIASNGDAYGWAFNNTTLGYITDVDQSYIGLIFWGSPSSSASPAYPGYPVA